MDLNTIDYINGISELIFVSIAIILSCLIIAKYPKSRNRTYLFVGIVWIGIGLPWMAGVISFLFTIITSNLISVELYLLIALSSMPLTFLFWTAAITDLIYEERRIIFLLVIGLWGIIFETIFLLLLFMDSSTLAILYSPLVIEYKLFIQVNLLIGISYALITGLIFTMKTRRTNEPEQKLRGNFLLIAFMTFSIGALLDTIFVANIPFILFKRFLLVLSSFMFYCSFILPNHIKQIFLKKN